jgi:hypothetical protein
VDTKYALVDEKKEVEEADVEEAEVDEIEFAEVDVEPEKGTEEEEVVDNCELVVIIFLIIPLT